MKKLTKKQADEFAKLFFGRKVEGKPGALSWQYDSGAVRLLVDNTYEDRFTLYPSAAVYVAQAYVCTVELIDGQTFQRLEWEEKRR